MLTGQRNKEKNKYRSPGEMRIFVSVYVIIIVNSLCPGLRQGLDLGLGLDLVWVTHIIRVALKTMVALRIGVALRTMVALIIMVALRIKVAL